MSQTLAAAPAAAAPPAPVKTGSAPSPFTLDQLNVLANRYAPISRFHPSEIYFMCSVEFYLQHSTLYGPNGFIKASPTVADLPTTGNKDDGKYWLVMQDTVKPGDLSTAKTYVHAHWEEGNAYTDLQYWFCYGYNGPGTLHIYNLLSSADIGLAPLGEHWVDWEMVTVRIKNDTQAVLGVFLSQHGSGEWISDLTKFERQNDQFIVYPSLNGHAIYAQPGTNPTESGSFLTIGWYLRNDTAVGGLTFNSANNCIIVSTECVPGFVEPNWVLFPYRWGLGTDSTAASIVQILKQVLGPLSWVLQPEINALAAAVAAVLVPRFSFDDTNGVYGPATQSYWDGSLLPQFNISTGYTGWNTDPSAPPCISLFNNLYHIFFKDHGGNGIMHITSPDGITWSESAKFYTGYNTSAGPCSVVFQNILYVFFRDGSGNGILHIQSSDGVNFAPSPNWYIGLNCDGQPMAYVKDSQLCIVAVDHGGNGIMWAAQTGLNGTWNHGYTGWNTSAVPSIVSFLGLWHVFFQDHNGKGIMHLTSPDGITWSESANFYTGFNTTAGPGAVVCDDVLYIFFRDGNGNGILYIQSEDGVKFNPAPGWSIGLNCDKEPRVTAANDSSMCLDCIDAGGNGIMRAVFNPW
jgi:hypothetical protein